MGIDNEEAEKSENLKTGDKVEVISDFRLQGTPIRLQKGWMGVVENIESDGHAFISFCDGFKGEWVSADDFKELSRVDQPTTHEAKETPRTDGADLTSPESFGPLFAADADDAEDDELADETLFVSERVMALIKGKLDKGSVPTQADITQLLDVSALPDDEELVSIDLSVLGIASPDVLTSKQAATQETTALIKKHGLKGAAEQCVKARDALASDDPVESDECDEEDEEEAEEEENEVAPVDEKVEESEEVVHGNCASKEKTEPHAKRSTQKGHAQEGEEEPARKRARAKAGA